MRRTATIWIGIALCAGALAGCGGSTDEPDGTATTSGAGATSAPATSGDAAGGGPSSAAYTDAEACEWLTQNLPKWEDITSEAGVQAQIAIGLSSFFEENGGLQNADGSAFDAATARGCPAERDAALAKAGIESFGSL